MKLWLGLIVFAFGCSTEKNNDLKQNIFVSAVKNMKTAVSELEQDIITTLSIVLLIQNCTKMPPRNLLEAVWEFGYSKTQTASGLTLAYPNLSYTFSKGLPIISVTPAITGGTASTCTSSPALPAGLSLDNTTCIISGTPTISQSAASYAITGSNSQDSTTASITITVNLFRQWSEIQSFLTAQQALGTTGSATAAAFGSLAGTNKWFGGVLAPNGKIYGIPYDSASVLVIDPSTDTASTFGSVGVGTAKWSGGVLAPNGKIYGIPMDSTSVLVIDPATNTTSTFGSLAGTWKWRGGVLCPNGKIYGIPMNSTSVLVIDPATDTANTFGSVGAAIEKWEGGVLAPDGKVYGIPRSETGVLVIDPATDTASTFGSLAGTWKWIGGAIAPDGKIYGMSFDSASVLVIDPSMDTASTFGSVGAGGNKWAGGVIAPNGRIYGIPWNVTNVLEIDTAANSTLAFGSVGSGYQGGILAPNGKIYGIPHTATSVLVIDSKSNGVWPSDLYLSPFFNKH
ncbi:MAG TPA: putative Ig domain-containing protein [Leptospiraceae bacterium]|nr:putative Ig domain-containing protein [Leptospiraceae bacterium]HNI94884.1 putative Ig domain-containing protein [Leptospiraceae bacterium]